VIGLSRSLTNNLFSQWGEEAAVAQLLAVTSPRDSDNKTSVKSRVLVEFGGSRGTDNSNFYRSAQLGFTVVMIEGDKNRFAGLEKVAKSQSSLIAINEWVEVSNNLESILQRHSISTQSVEGVSIDIDGDDALIFEHLGVSPQFVIVEHNPTLPMDGRYRNPKGRNIGNNLGELIAVADSKAMYPACLTETNIIFVSEKLRDVVQEIDVNDELSLLGLTRFGLGFDGTLVRFTTSGRDTTSEFYHSGWNHSLVPQPLPRLLRSINLGRTLTWTKAIYIGFAGLILRPTTFIRFLYAYLRNSKWSKSD
jgi:hypothetical protein